MTLRRFLPTLLVDVAPQFDADEVLFERASSLSGVQPHHGRRIVVSGNAAHRSRYRNILPFRWLRGAHDEPCEVMRLVAGEEIELCAWLAEERARAAAIDRAWVSLIGTPFVYHFARARWGLRTTHDEPWWPNRWLHPDALHVLRGLTHNATKLHRYGGGGVDDVTHSMLVRAALPPDASTAARLLALVHDHHEVLVSDLSSPLKRLMGDCAWREIEHTAAHSVEQIAGLSPTQEDRDLVRVADQVALRIEGRMIGAATPNPAELHPDPDTLFRMLHHLKSIEDVNERVEMWRTVWVADGGVSW